MRIDKCKGCRLSGLFTGVVFVALVGCSSTPSSGPSRRVSGGVGPFVVLIGAPASGKSTNTATIVNNYGVPSVEVGTVMEEEVRRASARASSGTKRASRRMESRSERARKINAALGKLRAGELVSEDTLNAVVAARILQEDCRHGFVLDGYPGSVEQAAFLDGLLDAVNVEGLLVIYLDVPDEIALERMKNRGRADDRRGFGEERLRQFRTAINPLLDFYEGDSLHVVDATKDLSEIEREILAICEKGIRAKTGG